MKIVVGLSGGVDSAVSALLAVLYYKFGGWRNARMMAPQPPKPQPMTPRLSVSAANATPCLLQATGRKLQTRPWKKPHGPHTAKHCGTFPSRTASRST